MSLCTDKYRVVALVFTRLSHISGFSFSLPSVLDGEAGSEPLNDKHYVIIIYVIHQLIQYRVSGERSDKTAIPTEKPTQLAVPIESV